MFGLNDGQQEIGVWCIKIEVDEIVVNLVFYCWRLESFAKKPMLRFERQHLDPCVLLVCHTNFWFFLLNEN